MQHSRRNFLKLSVGSALFAANPAGYAAAANATVIPKRKFGRHDDMLSVVGIGGHTLYLSGSQKEANEIAHRALDLGVNFFDNAWDYHDGESEVYVGNALKGRRDQVFLMSKFCNYHGGKNYTPDVVGSMKMLEDSLRRLKTDHLDLWMMHNVGRDDLEDAYRADGAVEAIELAKQQGKIRYAGFTGHAEPKVHTGLINGGYEWDATLMPISVVGAMNSRDFEAEVMPLCVEKNIAVLGMKGFGGSRRTELHGQTNVQEVLQYSLSYSQVCTHLVGVDKLEYIDQAVAGTAAKPFSAEQRAAYAQIDSSPSSPNYAALQHGAKVYGTGCSHTRHDV